MLREDLGHDDACTCSEPGDDDAASRGAEAHLTSAFGARVTCEIE
jgi:hypothetical protein